MLSQAEVPAGESVEARISDGVAESVEAELIDEPVDLAPNEGENYQGSEPDNSLTGYTKLSCINFLSKN